MKLVIGNKNLSSWSMRPWLLLKHSGLDFEEEFVPLDTPESKAMLEQASPSNKVPVLHDGPLVLWDSLAICEYIADKSSVSLWPASPEDKAHARSISAEMHSGFANLREAMPFNVRLQVADFSPELDTRIDINRIVQIFENALHGHDGPWLFGDFSVADAMYAPVLIRFQTHGIALPTRSRRYQETALQDEAVRQWCAAAAEED